MIILLAEAVIFAALTIVAIVFGANGGLVFLWVFVALDMALMAFHIFRKLRVRQAQPQVPNQLQAQALLPRVDDTFEMDGRQFEQFVALLFERLGYRIIRTQKSCDQGIDIIARRIFKVGIQCKCYNSPVGNKAVQEAAAGKKYYRLHRTMVVTNSIFTAAAVRLARKNKVRLIDRRHLAQLIRKVNGDG